MDQGSTEQSNACDDVRGLAVEWSVEEPHKLEEGHSKVKKFSTKVGCQALECGVRIKAAVCFVHGYDDACTFFFEGMWLYVNMICFGFYAKVFKISAAAYHKDLDKDSIGSIGVCGWEIEDFPNSTLPLDLH